MTWYHIDDGTLTIYFDFDFESSDLEDYLSMNAWGIRKINFTLAFPEPEDYSACDLARVNDEIESIVAIIDDVFTDLSDIEVTVYLTEKYLDQLECVLPFRQIEDVNCMLSYYIYSDFQDRVDMNSEWYEEIQDEDGWGDHGDSYGSDSYSDSEECEWDSDSD
ncbi:hypothetical protein NHQ30_004618 [Ciborinia camelliae]|nr:hypothetical protein NHQ30_004618 [Ciborinia camelliae]